MLQTIKRKLLFGNFSIIALLIANLILSLWLTSATQTESLIVRDEASRFAIKAKELQFATLQVQQWLTDISATRAAEGFDDGFDEAKQHAISFEVLLGEFAQYYESKSDQRNIQRVSSIRVAFAEYYRVGQEMAQAYIDEGPTAGNQLMKEFDPAAENINSEIDALVEYHVAALEAGVDRVNQHAVSQKHFGVVFSAIGMLLAFATSWYVARSILTPLQSTTNALKEIAEGSGDLSCRLDEQRPDEFGELGRHFNAFVTQIQEIVNAIGKQATRLAQSSFVLDKVAAENELSTDHLRIRSSSMTSSANLLEEAMSHSAIFTDQLSVNTKQLATSVDELTQSITEIAKGAERAAGVAKETSHLANATDQTIASLDSAAAEIGKVVDVIQEIAEQTNLLALNATIEAARAGESGRGFAVVATEVKVLAKQTADATQDIRSRIDAIQESSKEAVSAIREITVAIQRVSQESRTIAGAVEEQSITARELAGTVSQSSITSEKVALNTTNSSTTAKSIIREFDSINQGIGEISQTSSEAKLRVQELLSITEALEGLIKRYN